MKRETTLSLALTFITVVGFTVAVGGAFGATTGTQPADTSVGSEAVDPSVSDQASLNATGGTVQAGENLTVSFNLTNTGDETRGYVLNLTKSIPDTFTIANHTDDGGTYSTSGPSWVWTGIESGSSANPSVTLQVPESASGEYGVFGQAKVSGGVAAEANTTINVESTPELTLTGGSVDPSTVNESTTVSHLATLNFDNVSKDGNSDVFQVVFPNAVGGENLSANSAEVTNVSDGVSITSSIEKVDGPDDDGVMDTLEFAVSPDGGGVVDVRANVSVDVTWPAVAENTTDTIQVAAQDSSTGSVELQDAASVTIIDVNRPDFEVSNLSAPAEAVAGDTITVNATVTNNGSSAGTTGAEFVFGGSALASETVSLGVGESTNVSFDVPTEGVEPGTYEHGVFAGDSSQTAEITILQPATFEVSGLSAPGSAIVGTNITVNATITNVGDLDGNATAEFVFDGGILRSQNVTLGAGNATDVSFTVSTEGLPAGSYEHGVQTEDDGQFASISLTEPPEFLNVAGFDTSAFPTIRTFVNINTTAGRDGNLTADDFTLRENGVEQDITSVNFTGGNTTSDQPVDVVFVFDDSGSMDEEIDGMQRAVKNFTDQVDARRDARFALVSFRDDTELDLAYTGNATELKNAVDALEAGGGGDLPENNLDALNRGIELPTRPDAQKVLIDITDATAHYRGDGDGISDWTMPEMENKIESQGYTYIAISPDVEVSPGATESTDDDKKKLAEATNGLWIDIAEASTAEDFSEVIDEIGARLSTTWIIEYETADLVRGTDTRAVNVSVEDPEEGTIDGAGAFIPPRVSLTGADTGGFPTINATLDINTTAGRNGNLTLENFNVSEDGSEQAIEDLRFDSVNETWTIQYTTPDPERNGTRRQIAVTVTLESGSTLTVTADYRAPGIAANEPPVPEFTVSPEQPDVDETITLNASDSVDPDGTIVEYKWDLDGDGVYDDADGSVVTTSFGSAGNATVGLMIVDDGGATNTTTETINVGDAETISSGQPGLGIAVAVIALMVAALLARRER
jgi:PGF-CTERM protein